MDAVRNFERLFAYDAWANREILKALQAARPMPAKSLRWLSHVAAAEKLWLSRLDGGDPAVVVWPEITIEECQREVENMAAAWPRYLSGKDEAALSHSITYKNSKGEPWSSRIDDVMMHVTMHSTYHRGQIAADMRAAGFTPAYTDYIHAIRQGFVK
jgi:uncharacterized damage-inducible protein DinB